MRYYPSFTIFINFYTYPQFQKQGREGENKKVEKKGKEMERKENLKL